MEGKTIMELEELIKSVDIVEYISQFVELEERNEEFWGLSPFRDEKTPSFSVRRSNGSFYDFSSGIGGNVFTFIKYYNRCTAREAVEILKKYTGFNGEMSSKSNKLEATKVCRKYKKQQGKQKQQNTSKFPETCMEKYERPDDKLAVWESEGISRESLDKFQVCYDRFSDRLVYPIRDLGGIIVNIGGRTLDPHWKEKKLRKYTYFASWGSMNVIYGLFENIKDIIEKKEVILFEGCKSVLLANTWGIHNCGAILTSHLSPAQLKILARLGVKVVFALDKDVRIRDDHNIEKLKQYVSVEYIWDKRDMLGEKDSPVDRGKEVFSQLYNDRLKLR